MPDTLAALEELAKPADWEWFLKKMIVEAPALSMPDQDEGSFRLLFNSYKEHCAELTKEAITDAFRRWHDNEMYPDQPGRHGFFPRPNELNHLGQRAMIHNKNALFRARRALAHTEKLAPPKPTAEDRAKVREMMEEFRNTPLKSMPPDPGHGARNRHELAERIRAVAAQQDRPDEGEELV